MKSCALCLFVAFLPAAVLAQDAIRIEEVGLQGFYSASVPTPVRIHIPALAQTETIQLEVTINAGTNARVGPLRTDRFRKHIQVTSGEPVEIEAPILLPGANQENLHVAVTDSRGRKIGEDNLELRALKPVGVGDSLIAIYCKEDRQCLEAQEQIAPIRTGEQTPNQSKEFKFAMLKELRQNWWTYRPAGALVLAGSISSMTADQGKALEYYLRSGGTLVFLEKEVANAGFLAAYRQGPPRPEPVVVGRGRLYRLPSLEINGLGKLFRANALSQVVTFLQFVGRRSPVQVALGRVGTSFSFPRLPWLLTWLAVYILVVGLVNFAILRRLRRLESGWVTVCVAALFFAAGLYVASSSRRPKNFTLDSVGVYWMDGHSAVARKELGIRVSSPERTRIAISINDDVVLDEPQTYQRRDSSGVDIGAEMTDRRRIEPGWQVDLGPPLGIETSMLRWSFKDFYLEGFRECAGTVHWTSGMRLKNETGQGFREGIYLAFKANQRYTVPALASGAEIDLAGIVPKDIYRKDEGALNIIPQLGNVRVISQPNVRVVIQPKEGPFSVEELPYLGFEFGSVDRVFVGVSEAPVTNVGLDVAKPARASLVLTVVSLDQP